MTLTWRAAAWAALALVAALMAVVSWWNLQTAWLSTPPRLLPSAPPAARVSVPRAGTTHALPTSRAGLERATAPAGSALIKCLDHGEVTYTNDPQECAGASAPRAIVVYPTRGYKPYRR